MFNDRNDTERREEFRQMYHAYAEALAAYNTSKDAWIAAVRAKARSVLAGKDGSDHVTVVTATQLAMVQAARTTQDCMTKLCERGVDPVRMLQHHTCELLLTELFGDPDDDSSQPARVEGPPHGLSPEAAARFKYEPAVGWRS